MKPTRTFSQLGQDLVIRNRFKRDDFSKWYCVDVGCHHPIDFNNTYLFYELGARVLNIDPNSEFEALYKRFRGADSFCCSAIAEEEGDAKYYRYAKSQWNGLAENVNQKKHLLGVETLKVSRLESILSAQGAPKVIDFLSIDTEGFELSVLRSFSFSEYSVRCICLESRMSVEKHLKHPVHQYLKSGFRLFAHNGHDAFYIAR
ncbi:MAG: FkbM family methyltransferase [Opitutales bacterium]